MRTRTAGLFVILLLMAACGGGGGSSDAKSTDDTSSETTEAEATTPTTSELPSTLPAGQTPGQDDVNQDGMPDPICGMGDFGGGLVVRIPCNGKDYAPDPLEGTTVAPNSLLVLPAVQMRELFSEASADGVQARDLTGKLVYVFYIQSDVLFETGAAALTGPAQASLEGLARSIQWVAPSSPIQVRGHTDATGSASVNQTLSEQRAANVASFLAALGIAQSRLTSIGVASTRPLVLETNPDGSPTCRAAPRTAESSWSSACPDRDSTQHRGPRANESGASPGRPGCRAGDDRRCAPPRGGPCGAPCPTTRCTPPATTTSPTGPRPGPSGHSRRPAAPAVRRRHPARRLGPGVASGDKHEEVVDQAA